MLPPSELTQALEPVLRVMNQLAVRYFVGGSIAGAFHGLARSTVDVDLGTELNEATALKLAAVLRQEYYVSETAIREAVRHRTCFNLIHLATSFKVDLFIQTGRPFDLSVQARAISGSLGEHESLAARVATVEDVLLLKLEWYRLGGEVSDRQWSDVTTLTKLHAGRLDRRYMAHWAESLAVADLWARLLREVEPDGPT